MNQVHPFEVSLIVFAACAVITWANLLYLKIKDIRDTKGNGPIRFMLNDNRRRGVSMLLLSLCLLALGVIASSMSPRADEYDMRVQSYWSILVANFMSLGLFIEGLFTWRRREKLARLIAEYGPKFGGQRKNDPPVAEGAQV